MEQRFPSGKGPFSNADKEARRKHKRECRRVRLVDIARRKKGGNRNSPATAQRFFFAGCSPRSGPKAPLRPLSVKQSIRLGSQKKKKKAQNNSGCFFPVHCHKEKSEG